MYRKGIHSYSNDMNDLFPNLLEELEDMEIILPGEMGNLLSWIKDAISTETFQWTFDDMNNVMNSILWKEYSIFPSVGYFQLIDKFVPIILVM